MAAENGADAGGGAVGPVDEAASGAWRNPLTLGCLTLLLVHVTLKYAPTIAGGDWPKDGGLDTVGLVLVACAAAPVIAPHLTTAKLPGGIEFAFREVQRRQEVNEEEIAQLRFIVDGFVTEGELQHLLNIGKNVEYCIDAQAVEVVQAELRRLLALRLIDRRAAHYRVRTFVVADGKKRNIGEWFRLAPRGNEYLQMRDRNKADRRTAGYGAL